MSAKLPDKLLAKSPKGTWTLSLERHLLDTDEAAAGLFDPTRRFGKSYCQFFKIEEKERARFLLHLRVAALFHDLGKANEDFFTAVTSKERFAQTLRHEHVSALVLCLPEVRRWLAQNPALDVDVVTAAVLSHHLKAALNGDWQWCSPQGGRSSMKLYLEHGEVRSILDKIAKEASLGPPPALPTGVWREAPPWQDAWKSGRNAAIQFKLKIKQDKRRLTLLLATKAGLIVSDSVASGLVREGKSIHDWIEDVAHRDPIGPGDIERDILAPRAEQIRQKKGSFNYQCFQLGTAELGPRALVLAPCGAGKTLAAWKWAEAQSKARPIGKVIFLYPTRGTATEGFRDYVSWAPEADAALVHGTAKYEIDAMQSNPLEGREGKDFSRSEESERLFSLGLWPRRYFSATVDQFLGFMEHVYGGLCLLPVLADAAVIIDEVHSFDSHMFEVLRDFLRNFDVPVLCMTASLPETRRAWLICEGLVPYPTEEDRPTLKDLDEKEGHPRYRIQQIGSIEQARAEALDGFARGYRVLWVVNQVRRCQAIARDLRGALGDNVLCYHSRFKLRDRQRAHADTVRAFQQRGKPQIAVTTQVCEMSLDLDADLLITEVAPAPSLIQRFGRANRHLAGGLDFRAHVLVYKPEKDAPYQPGDMASGQALLDVLGAGDVSQRSLALALESEPVKAALVREANNADAARFLTSGYFATPGALREIDAFTSPSVLDGDLDGVMNELRRKKSIDGWVVPVPNQYVQRDAQKPEGFPRYLSIAPSAQYDNFLGFLDAQGEGA